jgi:hypothetical protein
VGKYGNTTAGTEHLYSDVISMLGETPDPKQSISKVSSCAQALCFHQAVVPQSKAGSEPLITTLVLYRSISSQQFANRDNILRKNNTVHMAKEHPFPPEAHWVSESAENTARWRSHLSTVKLHDPPEIETSGSHCDRRQSQLAACCSC